VSSTTAAASPAAQAQAPAALKPKATPAPTAAAAAPAAEFKVSKSSKKKRSANRSDAHDELATTSAAAPSSAAEGVDGDLAATAALLSQKIRQFAETLPRTPDTSVPEVCSMINHLTKTLRLVRTSMKRSSK
jgi:hypothetical protein